MAAKSGLIFVKVLRFYRLRCIRYNKHDYLNYKYNKKENYSENTIK